MEEVCDDDLDDDDDDDEVDELLVLEGSEDVDDGEIELELEADDEL